MQLVEMSLEISLGIVGRNGQQTGVKAMHDTAVCTTWPERTNEIAPLSARKG